MRIIKVLLLALVISSCASSLQKAGNGERQDLCQILDNIRAGQRIPVVVSGIYAVGQEHQILYDPEHPLCSEDIQPSTWVEFGANMPDHSELDRYLKSDRRAFVTFKGTLWGPGAVGPDDRSIPVLASWANRIRGRRYGHLSGFRTHLVVETVLEARAVPDSVPWDMVSNDPSRDGMDLSLKRGDVPVYPGAARSAGLEGEVEVEVQIQAGEVVSAKAVSGDRWLAQWAVANAKTWAFNPEVTTSFVTKFIYRLERRKRDAPKGIRVELDLPRSVTIVAPEDRW